jgi:hypothetical protein
VSRASRKTERTRSTGTPSNISSAICSAENPSRAFWSTASTGTRVPLITHCPDTLPGSRSTSGDFDQSIVVAPSFSADRVPILTRRYDALPQANGVCCAAGLRHAAPCVIAAPFSAIMMVGALVLVAGDCRNHRGVDDPQPIELCTRSSLSTTLIGCEPIMQVQLA